MCNTTNAPRQIDTEDGLPVYDVPVGWNVIETARKLGWRDLSRKERRGEHPPIVGYVFEDGTRARIPCVAR